MRFEKVLSLNQCRFVILSNEFLGPVPFAALYCYPVSSINIHRQCDCMFGSKLNAFILNQGRVLDAVDSGADRILD